MEKTLKELCLENSRKYEQDRIQKEHEKEQQLLKDIYEQHKQKIEQIREIIIQNSLEGKLDGTITIPLNFICDDDPDSEAVCIIKWFNQIGVKLSFEQHSFTQLISPNISGSYARQFNYRFQND